FSQSTSAAGKSVRFNDLFATVLSGPAESEWSRAILWRQCVDLLAQYGLTADEGGAADKDDLDRVAETLEDLRDHVSPEKKLAALRDLGRRLRSPRLVRLLLKEDRQVQVAAMTSAILPDGAWPAIIAEAGPLGRSVLRQRSDLGQKAQRALDAFGLSDLSLIDLNATVRETPVIAPVDNPAASDEAPAQEEQDQSQIKRIVDRIERFTSERQDRVHREAEARPEAASEPIATFTFLTDADGVIQIVHGAPQMQLSGLRLSTPSLDRSMGPDGQIMGAFRQRGAFREGRLTIGDTALAGCWLVDGDPLFNQRTGRFTGYRGTARRAQERDFAPQVSADIASDATQTGTPSSHSTSMRQLIHELRSPLSGVMGFAELIESQLLGPVDNSYRSMAGNIVDDVRTLVDILDDLDLANRSDQWAAQAGTQQSSAGQLVQDAVNRWGSDADGRLRIVLTMDEGLPVVDVAPGIAERMIAHFVRALAGCVGTETIGAQCRRQGERLLIDIERPAAMDGLSAEQLFDSGFEHVAVNPDAPVLGVGFALRLVRRLAQANKGLFVVHADHFTLALPVAADTADQEASS
ncbi:MAG: histidine kinase dimerization/phospho-acceptor domain-containing protein, partial [Sphingobium sp.]